MAPLGSASGTPFTGKLDGNGYSISNWNPSLGSAYDLGLFYSLGKGAIVQNLSLNDFVLVGVVSSYVGALAGSAEEAMIQNVSASGLNIQGQNYVGGLIGNILNTKITQVRISGRVSANLEVGGLVGAAELGSEISGVRSEASVEGNQLVGGLVGRLDSSTIQKSFAFANVTGIGGSPRVIGGLVGQKTGDPSSISDSAVGGVGAFIISGGEFIGGLVGKNSTNLAINRCYVAAQIISSSSLIAGLVVDTGGVSTLDSFFDSDVGRLTGGKTTNEMQTQSTFVNWDFDNTWQISSGSYPLLRW
jgi:hypothetical protein